MFTPRDSARRPSVAFARSRCERETGSRPGYGEKKSGLVKCMYDGQSDGNTGSSSVARPSRRSEGVLVGGDPQQTLDSDLGQRPDDHLHQLQVREAIGSCLRNGASCHDLYDMSDHYENRWDDPIGISDIGWYTSPRGVFIDDEISRCERVGRLPPPGASTPACLSQEGAGAPLDPVAQSRRGRGSAIDVSRHRGHQVMEASAPSAYPSWCKSARSCPPEEGGAGCFLPVTG
jgi:hypothetical protein